MNSLDWRATLALGAVYALRMLGVFMILPVAAEWSGPKGLVVGLALFFLALVSRRAPAQHKGAAMGVHATAQFSGQPLGGALGGWTLAHYGPAGTLAAAALLPLLWLGFAVQFRPAPRARNLHG